MATTNGCHPFLDNWLKNYSKIRAKHPNSTICIPWKRIYEVIRHYDLSTLMIEFENLVVSQFEDTQTYFGIERVADGVSYRLRGGKMPLKLLYPVPAIETHTLINYKIEPTVVSVSALQQIIKTIDATNATHPPTFVLPLHLWLNTGYRTTGLASREELGEILELIDASKHVTCRAIGSKFPYESDITTFSDFYKHTPKTLNNLIKGPSSMHSSCLSKFHEILGNDITNKYTNLLIHSGTSFEVLGNAVDPKTNMITVGNLFYYGFSPRTYKWPLEIQQISNLSSNQYVNISTRLLKPEVVATLFSRIPTQHIAVGGTADKPLQILDEDLNYGKVVVRLSKSIKKHESPKFFAKRRFF